MLITIYLNIETRKMNKYCECGKIINPGMIALCEECIDKIPGYTCYRIDKDD